MKKCCTCKTSRAKEEFSMDMSQKDGLSRRCKTCSKQRSRAYYESKENTSARKNEVWKITGEKKCSSCGKTKEATPLFFSRRGVSGLSSICKACDSERKKANRVTREKKVTATHKQCVRCWQLVEKSTGFYKCSRLKDGLSVYCKACQKGMLDDSRAKHQKKWNKARSAVIEASPQLRMHYRILGLVRKSIERRNMKERPLSVTHDFWRAVDYSRSDLTAHLERQFLPGMGWHNMRQWHIDHIVPVKDFSVLSFGDAEFMACWSLSNLRPLWAADNIIKRDKREFLI